MSHASDVSRRPSRARRAALVVAALVALGACSHQREVPDKYGDLTRDNFTEGCETALTQSSDAGEALSSDVAGDVCECSYESISDADTGIPFEEFNQLNTELEEEPTELPDAFADRIEACAAEAGLG